MLLVQFYKIIVKYEPLNVLIEIIILFSLFLLLLS